MHEHRMSLQHDEFERIQIGIQSVELRLLDRKRRKVRVGDTVTFTDLSNGAVFSVAVQALDRFATFREAYGEFSESDLGYLQDETADYHDMYRHYRADEESEYGVLAISFTPLSPVL